MHSIEVTLQELNKLVEITLLEGIYHLHEGDKDKYAYYNNLSKKLREQLDKLQELR